MRKQSRIFFPLRVSQAVLSSQGTQSHSCNCAATSEMASHGCDRFCTEETIPSGTLLLIVYEHYVIICSWGVKKKWVAAHICHLLEQRLSWQLIQWLVLIWQCSLETEIKAFICYLSQILSHRWTGRAFIVFVSLCPLSVSRTKEQELFHIQFLPQAMFRVWLQLPGKQRLCLSNKKSCDEI